jgi:hypothetical protein
MHTFTRLFSIAAFLLSLGFIAQALPTPAKGAALSVRQYGTPASYSGNDDSYGTSSYGKDEYEGGEYGHGQTINVLDLVLGLETTVSTFVDVTGEFLTFLSVMCN